MRLFQLGNFKLHSGQRSFFKIDCDYLIDSDLECLAKIASEFLPKFGTVVGIPSGGLLFAEKMRAYSTSLYPRLLVDDVYTTGRSMEDFQRGGDIGLVIFAREKCPNWIYPIFKMK